MSIVFVCDCLLQVSDPLEEPMALEEIQSTGAESEAELDDYHILDSKCSWVGEHFKSYEVKTPVSVKDEGGNHVKDEKGKTLVVEEVKLRAKCIHRPKDSTADPIVNGTSGMRKHLERQFR